MLTQILSVDTTIVNIRDRPWPNLTRSKLGADLDWTRAFFDPTIEIFSEPKEKNENLEFGGKFSRPKSGWKPTQCNQAAKKNSQPTPDLLLLKCKKIINDTFIPYPKSLSISFCIFEAPQDLKLGHWGLNHSSFDPQSDAVVIVIIYCCTRYGLWPDPSILLTSNK